MLMRCCICSIFSLLIFEKYLQKNRSSENNKLGSFVHVMILEILIVKTEFFAVLISANLLLTTFRGAKISKPKYIN